MSDTPRTDNYADDAGTTRAQVVHIDFARKLERGLAAMRERAETAEREAKADRERCLRMESQLAIRYRLRKEIIDALGATDGDDENKAMSDALATITGLRERAERAEAALREIRDYDIDWRVDVAPNVETLRAIADEALGEEAT